jgi:hypothetical protein
MDELNFFSILQLFVRCKGNHDAHVVYLVPSKPYEYDHPEGTGKDIPPFNSLWYCGIGKDLVMKLQQSELWQSLGLLRNLNDLRQCKAIPTNKRPNPKQRKKRKASTEGLKKMLPVDNVVVNSSMHTNPPENFESHRSCSVSSLVKKRKRSKHRNEMGFRAKKRF